MTTLPSITSLAPMLTSTFRREQFPKFGMGLGSQGELAVCNLRVGFRLRPPGKGIVINTQDLTVPLQHPDVESRTIERDGVVLLAEPADPMICRQLINPLADECG